MLLPTAALPPTCALTCGSPPPLCHENGKGQQFPLRDGQELTGIEVTKAVGGKIVLNVLLIFRRGGTHGVDMLPENGFLCGDAIRQSAFLRDGLTARPRQGNAFFRQYLIDSVHSIFSFAKTDIMRTWFLRLSLFCSL